MKRFRRRRLALITLLTGGPFLSMAAPSRSASREAKEVKVEAGSFDRRDTVVSLALPAAKKRASYRLRDAAGSDIPLQIDAQGKAWFVLKELKAGSEKTYRLEVQNSPSPPAVTASKQEDAVHISLGGRPVFRYQGGKGALPAPRSRTPGVPDDDIKPVYRRGGYIHPLFTPSGRIVTDDYPSDHRHHHGIWFAWTKTEFQGRSPDFWNVGGRTATIEFESLDDIWSGAVHAGLRARHRYVDLSGPKPTTALKEQWEARAYAVGTTLFDLDVTQECATSSPLILPEYHYGGLGLRGARGWKNVDEVSFLTSEGKDRSSGDSTRGRWSVAYGRVDGEVVAIAVFGHPENFRAPEPMRINPKDPFFCFAPSQLGQWRIDPVKPYVWRYRFAALDGAPDAKELDRLWNDYANPPRVIVK